MDEQSHASNATHTSSHLRQRLAGRARGSPPRWERSSQSRTDRPYGLRRRMKGTTMNFYSRPKNESAPAQARSKHDDVWITSSCALCYGTCSTLVHRVDGVVVKIEGNPDSVVGKGKLCGKGVSGIMTHYDPYRLKKPLRRTNPDKGIGIDPGWKEISWDEALDEVAAQLRRVRAEDPRKLIVQRTTTVTAARVPIRAFASRFRYAPLLGLPAVGCTAATAPTSSAASCMPPGRWCRISPCATTPSISVPPRGTPRATFRAPTWAWRRMRGCAA